mgnify:CR=1 FL=1
MVLKKSKRVIALGFFDGVHLGHAALLRRTVEEAARRHGVGDALLDVFCRFGQAHLSFLTLEVRASNAPAIALYRKHGFQEAGRRKNYYDHPKEDAIIMTKEFGAAEAEAQQ